MSNCLINCCFFCSKKYLSNKDVAEKLSKENTEGKVSHLSQRRFLISHGALLQFNICMLWLSSAAWVNNEKLHTNEQLDLENNSLITMPQLCFSQYLK